MAMDQRGGSAFARFRYHLGVFGGAPDSSGPPAGSLPGNKEHASEPDTSNAVGLKPPLQGFGGWLIVVILVMYMELSGGIQNFARAWNGSKSLDQTIGLTILLGPPVAAWIVTFILMLAKHIWFPRLYTLVVLAFFIVYGVIKVFFPASQGYVGVFDILALALVPYMHISERVRNTFTKKFSSDQNQRGIGGWLLFPLFVLTLMIASIVNFLVQTVLAIDAARSEPTSRVEFWSAYIEVLFDDRDGLLSLGSVFLAIATTAVAALALVQCIRKRASFRMLFILASALYFSTVTLNALLLYAQGESDATDVAMFLTFLGVILAVAVTYLFRSRRVQKTFFPSHYSPEEPSLPSSL